MDKSLYGDKLSHSQNTMKFSINHFSPKEYLIACGNDHSVLLSGMSLFESSSRTGAIAWRGEAWILESSGNVGKNPQHFNSDCFWKVGGGGVYFYSLVGVSLLFFVLYRERVSLT